MSSRGTISFVKYSLRKEYVRSIFLVTRLCLFSFFFHSECIHVTCLAWDASSSPSICGGAHFTIPLRSPFAGFGCFMLPSGFFQDAGIPFEVNSVAMHFSGTIGLCLADNLGSHSWGGFMESFSAYRKCRFCMGTPEDI